uniref:Si:dkey-98f17.5 n=1 Tax=Oncorhynchus mykiss TaxID=8022 RepID=A0A8C7PL72_ONCMY
MVEGSSTTVMSGGRKPRSVANPLESAITTPSERILRECHNLYIDSENGLVKISSRLGLRLLPPRKKIIVMIMGNHSAGKSSFINWYVEEHIQKTGVAIETQGFTFITSGRKRESLTGNATLHLYPHFRPLLEFKGVTDYLSAEISTSKQKKFSLVTFVDTPGLVDGDMVYPFDVNRAITSFGEQADLVFVFFDPMGQALCKRTLNIVEKLSDKVADKLRFYLSKADEAGRETDRQNTLVLAVLLLQFQLFCLRLWNPDLFTGRATCPRPAVFNSLETAGARVMMQIVQELCRRPGLNKCGFEMPTIYIPNPQKPSRCVNQIDGVCQTIEKTINQAVQKTLDQLEKDCDLISSTIDSKLSQDRADVSFNSSVRLHSFLCGALGILLPCLFILSFVVNTLTPEELQELLGDGLAKALGLSMGVVVFLWTWIPEDFQILFVIIFGVLCYFFFCLAKYFARQGNRTLTKKEKRSLTEYSDYVQDVVKAKKGKLYEEYLAQCAAEYDF